MTRKISMHSVKYVANYKLRVRGKKMIRDRVLARRVDDLQRTYDRQFTIVYRAIRQLMTSSACKRNQIGFRAEIPKKQDRR